MLDVFENRPPTPHSEKNRHGGSGEAYHCRSHAISASLYAAPLFDIWGPSLVGADATTAPLPTLRAPLNALFRPRRADGNDLVTIALSNRLLLWVRAFLSDRNYRSPAWRRYLPFRIRR